MRVAIHQPNFLPRLKVLQKLASADCWVVLDSVQFAQREWQNRATMLAYTARQNEFWLTLPVNRPNGRETLISEVTVKELSRTIQRCRQSLQHAFRSAAHWNAVADYWSEVEQSINSDSLIDVVLPTMTVALKRFALLPKVVLASELNVAGRKSILMANMCQASGASEYLADSGALAYLEVDFFVGVKVVWQHWRAPAITGDLITWRNLSFINFLARHGAAALRDHLLSGVFCSADALSQASMSSKVKSEASR